MSSAPLAYDVVIAGGGPAGLEAALILGRARRRVLLCDTLDPRNAPAEAAHGVFTRDGTPPSEIRRIAQEQLAPYVTVTCERVAVTDAVPVEGGFRVSLGDGREVQARKLLLATGLRDELPPVTGMREFWGKGVFHCPYCHAFEVSDRPLGVYGRDADALQLAALLTNWSKAITLYSDGPAPYDADARRLLVANGISLCETTVSGLEGGEGGLSRVLLQGTQARDCHGLFVRTVLKQRTAIPERLGCRVDARNLVEVDASGMTAVPGLYVAGDPANKVHSVLLAAASGATAAFAINAALTDEEVRARM